MSNRNTPAPETIEKTEVLLWFIKDAFQAFSFKEGDRSKVMTWAEGLEPVIDWTVDGVLDYIHDSHFAKRKDPPSLADVYDMALKAKNRAEEPDRLNDNTYIPPAEQQEVRGHKQQYRELAERFVKDGLIKRMPDSVLTDEELLAIRKKRQSAPDREALHKRQREAVMHLAKKDLPFVPDAEQVARYLDLADDPEE